MRHNGDTSASLRKQEGLQSHHSHSLCHPRTTMLQKCPRSCFFSHRALLLPGQLCWKSVCVPVKPVLCPSNDGRGKLLQILPVTTTFKTIRSRLILQHFSLKFCQPFVVNLSTSRNMQTGFTNAIFGLGYLGTSHFLFLPPPKQSTLQLEALLLFAQNIPELAIQGFESPCSQDGIPGPETSVKCQNGYIDCCLRNAYF